MGSLLNSITSIGKETTSYASAFGQLPDAPIPANFADPGSLDLNPPQNSMQNAQSAGVQTLDDIMGWMHSYKSPENQPQQGQPQQQNQAQGLDRYRQMAKNGEISGSEFSRVTGRASGYATQSPRDTTPSGSRQMPGDHPNGGFTSQPVWNDAFQGQMQQNPTAVRPASGYSWESQYPKGPQPSNLTNPNAGSAVTEVAPNRAYASPI